jgi:hypothetical protein
MFLSIGRQFPTLYISTTDVLNRCAIQRYVECTDVLHVLLLPDIDITHMSFD